MNPDPDYSAAVAIVETDGSLAGEPLSGHGMTFTIGRGTEICVAAIRAFEQRVVGRDLDEIEADLGAFWRSLAGDSQLRWLGPEKGVIHLAMAAVVNAVWDVLARRAGRADREAQLHREGYPAYVTSAGWLGYDEETIRRRCREAVAAGWTHFKIKVGQDLQADLDRCRVVREEIGPHRKLMVEHFVHPVSMRDGHYVLPSEPGLGVEFKAASLDRYSYPDGPVWRERAGL